MNETIAYKTFQLYRKVIFNFLGITPNPIFMVPWDDYVLELTIDFFKISNVIPNYYLTDYFEPWLITKNQYDILFHTFPILYEKKESLLIESFCIYSNLKN